MRRTDRGAGDAGFTLVELIVCLGLLALMTTLMAEGVAIARRGGRSVAFTERLDAVRAVRMHLRRTLERVEPHFETDRSGAAVLMFAGSAESLRLVTRADGRLESGGLVLVDILVAAADHGGQGGATAGEPAGDHPGGRTLITRRRPLASLSDAPRKDDHHALLEGVESVRFRYSGRAAATGEPLWTDAWADPSALPVLVEIDLTFRVADQDLWPPLAVALPAALMGPS